MIPPGITALALMQTDREQGVGGLGLTIGAPLVIGSAAEVWVVEVDPGPAVRHRRQRHHPGGPPLRLRAVHQGGGQLMRQEEVAKMVGPELGLETVARVGLGASHHACVVDEQVQGRTRPAAGEGANGGEVGEVQALDPRLRPARRLGDLVRGGEALIRPAHGQDNLAPLRAQGLGGLEADTGRPAGHDRRDAGQVVARGHLAR